MAGDSKTEKATPKKRRDERKKGNVLMSKDAVAVATLIGSLFMVQMMGGVFMEQMGQVLNTCFGYIAGGTVETLPVELPVLLKRTALSFFAVVGPFLGVTALLAVGVTFAFLEVDIVPAAAVIGVTTFCLSLAGVAVGNFFGARYKRRAELSGGVILILLGGKILLEHLGVF